MLRGILDCLPIFQGGAGHRLNPVHLVLAVLWNGKPGKDRKQQTGSFETKAMSSANSASVEQSIELEGTIQTVLPGTMFRVVLDNQHQVLAHISGKMRRHFMRLTVGDRVRLEMSPYDLTKARITYRLR